MKNRLLKSLLFSSILFASFESSITFDNVSTK